MTLRLPARLSAASAAAASAPVRELSEFDYQLVDTSQKPTKEQLASLSAIPSGMIGAADRSQKSLRSRSKRGGKLVRDGQVVSRVFASAGARPQPSNGLSFDQSVRVELMLFTSDYLTSSTTAGVFTGAAWYSTLNNFSGATALTAVFDQYRFLQVEHWLEPVAPLATANQPELVSAVDLDDSSTPTAAQIIDKIGAISSALPGGHYHKYVPHMAIATYAGAFTSYGNAPAGWIDCGSPAVQHYGLKVGVTSQGTTAIKLSMVVRAVIEFRNPSIN